MININHLKADLKQIRQEPIMMLFAFLSLLLIGVFKAIIVYGAPLLYKYTGFNLLTYELYLVGMVYMLQPMMLGTIMGFFMLDEKDAKIFELLRVTPLGFSGYMVNRMLPPVVLNLIYALVAYAVLGVHVHEPSALITIIVFLSIETAAIGLFIAMVAQDKVKGLTYAKAVSGLMLFGFVDLVPIDAVQFAGKLVPYYYVTKMLVMPNAFWIALGLAVHFLWFYMIYRRAMRRL